MLDNSIKSFSSHDFVLRKTKTFGAELHVCARCGATKNRLTLQSKCKPDIESLGRIERHLK